MPAPAAPPVDQPASFFKSEAELQAFIARTVAEEVTPALERAIAPLTERQTHAMREMLDADRALARNARPPGHMFARFCRAKALALRERAGTAGDLDGIESVVRRFWGDDQELLAGLKGMKTLQKATAAQVGDPGSLGNLVIPEWSREFIKLLRNMPLIRSIARVIPNPSGSLTLRRQTSGALAYWVGESSPAIPPSKPGVGLMNFTRKKQAALAVMSNDLLRTAASEADQFVLDELLIACVLAEDLAFIRGDGTEFSPRGIRSLIDPANVLPQTGTTLADIDNDLSLAVQALEEANVITGDATEQEVLHWLLVPRTKRGLWLARPTTDTGARPYREELDRRRLLGYPAHVTNQVPKNLGGGGNATETYFVHGPSLMIADTLNTVVDVFPGGAYQDGAVVISGISTDETIVRVLRETDFNMRHQQAGAVIKDVTLGA